MLAEKGNKYDLGLNSEPDIGGRPPTFEKPVDLEVKCNEYFNYCIENKEKPTITGLTLYVGFSSRSSWDDYNKREGFSYIVKRAKLTVEHSYEINGQAFDIFALKNMGWKDRQEITQTNINTEPLSQEEIDEAKKKFDNDF